MASISVQSISACTTLYTLKERPITIKSKFLVCLFHQHIFPNGTVLCGYSCILLPFFQFTTINLPCAEATAIELDLKCVYMWKKVRQEEKRLFSCFLSRIHVYLTYKNCSKLNSWCISSTTTRHTSSLFS